MTGRWLATALASAIPLAAIAEDDCARVRAVKALAVRHQLDAATLEKLEAMHCGDKPSPPPLPPPPPPPQAARESRDCADLQMMARLARLGSRPDIVKLVEEQIPSACASPGELAPFKWPNGIAAKRPDGSWQYPNAAIAKTADGRWQYPTNVTARGYDGAWRYPNAVTARRSDGKYHSPTAATMTLDELLGWCCERLGKERCGQAVERIHSAPDELKEALVVELAWDAYRGRR